MVLNNDLKEAVSLLPNKEKDKLIFRLLKKEPSLAKKLYFELVDTKSVEERRVEMENEVMEKVTYFT